MGLRLTLLRRPPDDVLEEGVLGRHQAPPSAWHFGAFCLSRRGGSGVSPWASQIKHLCCNASQAFFGKAGDTAQPPRLVTTAGLFLKNDNLLHYSTLHRTHTTHAPLRALRSLSPRLSLASRISKYLSAREKKEGLFPLLR